MRININFIFMFFINILFLTNILHSKTSNSNINLINEHQRQQEDKINSSFIPSLLYIQYPQQIKDVPNLKGYYKGNRLPFRKDFCTIIEPSILTYFTLVVTQEVKHTAGGNNIKWLERIKDIPAHIYYISYTGNPENAWHIEQEKDIKNISLRIPYNALVLLMPADLVENLKVIPQLDKKQEEPHVIYLPKIVIKPDITQNELDNAYLISTLASLDLDTIHEYNKTVTKQVGNTVISLDQVN